ncbi:CLUMA_CG009407, isoform B [Clunio marinus]|uniref:non-specific protein-tyrosine kinase n=1 Tax=Clunio marinus TaxID=568069 RepID=A0A1J1IAI1_9DIPT|nr:CLUMA_CG009407, isoform B [Clunio marinus]
MLRHSLIIRYEDVILGIADIIDSCELQQIQCTNHQNRSNVHRKNQNRKKNQSKMDERKEMPDLYEFLVEAELQQYYSSLKNELKITAIHQLKYATDNDFKSIGFSRPEIRRLHKFHDKYYSQGYLILDKNTSSPYWLGVLNSGKVGLFNPANTVAHLESLPSSSSSSMNNNHHGSVGGSFIRNTLERNSKRKLNTDMISSPQNDLKHTGHVGIDGAYFGNVAFISNSQTYNKLPRQVVTPYKPSEDLEQTPLLLPPTPTSPDSTQTGSAYFSESSNLIPSSNAQQHERSHNNIETATLLSGDFQRLSSTIVSSNGHFNESNPFAQSDHQLWTTEMAKNFVVQLPQQEKKVWDKQESHDYHEISDDEMMQNDKVFDFGPSLLDEMDFMFRSMTTGTSSGGGGGESASLNNPPLTPNFENVNKRNELTEINSKLSRKSSGGNAIASGMTAVATYKSKKKASTVKPISVKDEKILNQAIEIANEMSARSMTDLDQSSSTQSPRRKFSFRFPNLTHSSSNHDKDNGQHLMTLSGGSSSMNQHGMSYLGKDRRNFSEEAKNVPDLQRFRSLTEIESCRDSNSRDIKIPIFDKKTSDFCFEKSREILSKPFSIDLNTSTLDKRVYDKKTRDLIGENLLDIEKTLNALNLDFLQAFNELEKTDSAETLFGENFLLQNNLKSQGSVKTMANFKKLTNDLDNTVKKSSSSTRDYYSPLDRRSTASDKSYSPKDSQKTTPNSYSPQESTATSRGLFFNYNPINSNRSAFISPTKRMFANQQFLNQARKYDETFQTGPRQRSMSFTENLEIKSPTTITTISGVIKPMMSSNNTKGGEVRKTGSLDEEKNDRNYILPSQGQLLAHKPRNIITYKPKSIRARNLRRLSYNPLNMVDSSSSSSESDMDRSIAHSECDIRSKSYSSRFQKRRQQYLNNHHKLHNSTSSSYYQRGNSQYSNNSSNSNMNGRDKLYGSNASIKSAPHYNYMSDRKRFSNDDRIVGGEDKTTMSSSDIESDDDLNSSSISDQRKKNLFESSRTLTPTQQPPQPPPPPAQQTQITSNFNNIYEFVGKCFNRSYSNSSSAHNEKSSNVIKQQQQQKKYLSDKYSQVKSGKLSSSNLDLLYSDFDVSKLTGKSPTTQSYFDIMDYSNLNRKSSLRQGNKTSINSRGGSFHWPEKIHGATVKQNDLIRQLQQQHEQDMQEKEERRQQQKRMMIDNLKMKKSTYSSDSTSTENDSLNFRHQEFMPPSPAP